MANDFRPFADQDVQNAVQHLVRVVSDVALRQGVTPLSIVIAAAALHGRGRMDIDTMICGEPSPEAVAPMTQRILQTAMNEDGQAETLDLPRPN